MNSSLFVLIILFSIPCVLAFGDLTDDKDWLLNQGKEFIQDQKFEQAISYFDKVLEIEPNHVDALFNKGRALVQFGRTNEAILYFDKVLEIEPNHVDALFNKGRALIQFGKLDQPDKLEEGMSYVERVLEIEPNHVDALSYKGDELIRTGKYDEAISYFDKVLEIEPNHVDALFLKGIVFARNDNFYEAMSYFDKVLKINQHHTLAGVNALLATKKLGYEPLDGFLDVKVHDSHGNLAAHLKITRLNVLNHEIAKNFIDEWPLTKVITRNGKEFEVLQHELEKKVHMDRIYGGAVHYGITSPHDKDLYLISANYWQYLVQKGDTVTFVYTTFRSIG